MELGAVHWAHWHKTLQPAMLIVTLRETMDRGAPGLFYEMSAERTRIKSSR